MLDVKALITVAVVFMLCACAAENLKPSASPAASNALSSAPASDVLKSSPLDQLWQARSSRSTDFPIGMGDVLEISIPGLQGVDAQLGSARAGAQLESTGGEPSGNSSSAEAFRVDGFGDIVLPLLGRIHVAGLTEQELRTELVHRLDHYMYDPEVKIFVQSYNSRKVAVSGEVRSPGMYIVNGPEETIHDLIIRAGGSTGNAASKVILTPAKDNGPRTGPPYSDHSIEGNSPPADSNTSEAWQDADARSGAASYVINLSREKSAARYLDIPVRPGDTIYVPRAGSVTVTGWVYTPRSIDITPGLTVLGAVSAAGGPLFAADATRVKILRQGAGQETKTTFVNLNSIKAARTLDMLVQANDIVDVPYSSLRIPGYAFYYGLKGLIEFAPATLLVR